MKKILIALALIILVIIGISYFWLDGITRKIFIPPAKTAVASKNSIQQSLDSLTPINILLLGYGGGNHDGAYLTDSIITVHIDPKTEKIFLISIPRDIWVKIPTKGADGIYSKINAAYQIGLDDMNYPDKQKDFTGAAGGAKLAEYTVSQITGLPIDFFIGIDFSGFTKSIDALEGVDIIVDKTFDDYEYPIEGKQIDACGRNDEEIASLSAQLASPSATVTQLDAFPCRYERLHFDAGRQHMDGATVLKYVRSRHSLQDGTDFGRAQRQRNLLVAVKQKIFSVGFIPQVLPFMTSLGDDLRTDLTLDDVRVLLQNASALNKYRIISLALTGENFLQDAVSSDGQIILESKDGRDNWTNVHRWLENEFSGKPQPVQAVVQLQNGTPVAGLGQLAAIKLRKANLNVLDPVNASVSNTQKTTITVYDKNINKSDIDSLKKEFGVNKIIQATADQTQYNVLVIIGEDYNQKKEKN